MKKQDYIYLALIAINAIVAIANLLIENYAVGCLGLVCSIFIAQGWWSFRLISKVQASNIILLKANTSLVKKIAERKRTESLGLYLKLDYKRVYLSLPISGLPIEDVENRLADAKKTFKMIGKEVVSPLENGLPMDSSYEDHMKRDLELLSECDAICMMQGWENSKGCRIEFEEAVNSKKIILFDAPL